MDTRAPKDAITPDIRLHHTNTFLLGFYKKTKRLSKKWRCDGGVMTKSRAVCVLSDIPDPACLGKYIIY
jgi:hypothetical protein